VTSSIQARNCPLPLSDYPDDFSACHRRLLSARRISACDLHKSLRKIHDVDLLSDAKHAAQLIYDSIKQHRKIVIVGDYDADGATAMAILLSVLRRLGAYVDTLIPNRVTMGYGLSQAATAAALKKHPELVITVDNGITATASVETLKKAGMQVIITDHHLPGHNLPVADHIVNPNKPNCAFPSKNLAGVGVAFYVVLALRQIYREAQNPQIDNIAIADLLPLVAIGTIADVVSLDMNNRILVEQGLKRIRAGTAPKGILALLDIAQINPKRLSTSDIAFQIAPRLNAAGRIADMQLGVDCLTAHNERLAMDYALELDRLNRERKVIENEARCKAEKIATTLCQHNTASHSLCLFDAKWHEGIIGILASRLKDKYQKSVFIFTQSHQGLKASGRAVKQVSLIAALNQVNANCPELIDNFGGHAKAAGLTLAPEHFECFAKHIETAIAQQLDGVDTSSAILTDGALLTHELSLENAEFIRLLEPWGMDLPEPAFCNEFYINRIREAGKNHAQLELIEQTSGQTFKGIAFDKFSHYHQLEQQRCRIVFQLSVNEWQHKRSLSLVVSHIEKMY